MLYDFLETIIFPLVYIVLFQLYSLTYFSLVPGILLEPGIYIHHVLFVR